MSQAFELKRLRNISPSCGEDLGGALANAAEHVTNRLAKAQMLYLAAEAFEQGASASIGHGRAGRYEQAARELRQRAEQLEAEVKAERDEAEAKRLMNAFLEGFNGNRTETGTVPSKFAFDSRDAFIIGEHFAKEGKQVPERINAPYINGQQYFDIDEVMYEMVYPDGSTLKAFPREVATD